MLVVEETQIESPGQARPNDTRPEESETQAINEKMFWVQHHNEETDNDKEDVTVSEKHSLHTLQEELEEEKQQNRELQAQIDALRQKQKERQQQQKEQKQKQAKKRRNRDQTATSAHASADHDSKELVSLQTQVEGYKQLVDALTTGRPAVDAAVAALNHPRVKYAVNHDQQNNSRSLTEPNVLPIHMVRFLDFMPYHPIAQQAATVTEELYEWQVYHAEKQVWRSNLVFFPAFFKALPLIQPDQADHDTKAGVWTNQSLSHRFDLQNGYFTPNNATEGGDSGAPSWKWIGPWAVDTAASSTSSLVDNEGWAYAKEAGHFLDHNQYIIPPSSVLPILQEERATFSRRTMMVRRRKWVRTRLLVDYPMACEPTVQYLALRLQSQELLLHNGVLQSQLQQAEQQITTLQHQQEQRDDRYRRLEVRLQTLDRQAKHQRDLLERQRGPPLQHFSFVVPNHNVHKEEEEDNSKTLSQEQDSDDDSSVVSNCSSNSSMSSLRFNDEVEDLMAKALKNLDHVLLLQPQQDAVERRDDEITTTGNRHHSHCTTEEHCEWQLTKEEKDEPVPEMETCSIVTNSERTEDDSEQISMLPGQGNTTTTNMMSDDSHRSFLQKLFAH